jgi:cytochrome c oxidase subunit 3
MSVAVAVDRELAARWHVREIGLWMFLGTVAMLFAAFTSALVVRRSTGDWIDVHLPFILWVNTGVLVTSSATLERARRLGSTNRRRAVAWVAATCVLGILFFGGQIEAWRELSRLGFYLPTSPAASFFYVLTGVHATHLVAALLCVVLLLARTVSSRAQREWPYIAGAVATFWHFLTGVWIYLLAVMQAA